LISDHQSSVIEDTVQVGTADCSTPTKWWLLSGG